MVALHLSLSPSRPCFQLEGGYVVSVPVSVCPCEHCGEIKKDRTRDKKRKKKGEEKKRKEKKKGGRESGTREKNPQREPSSSKKAPKSNLTIWLPKPIERIRSTHKSPAPPKSPAAALSKGPQHLWTISGPSLDLNLDGPRTRRFSRHNNTSSDPVLPLFHYLILSTLHYTYIYTTPLNKKHTLVHTSHTYTYTYIHIYTYLPTHLHHICYYDIQLYRRPAVLSTLPRPLLLVSSPLLVLGPHFPSTVSPPIGPGKSGPIR